MKYLLLLLSINSYAYTVQGKFVGYQDMSSVIKLTDTRYLFLSNQAPGPQEAILTGDVFKVGKLYDLGIDDPEAIVNVDNGFSMTVGSHSKGDKSKKITQIDKDGKVIRTISLAKVMPKGTNIEGAAWDAENSYLVVGFRSPANTVMKYKNDSDYKMLKVNLNGQGVREMVKIDEGYLIISGNMDSGQEFYFWFWDGNKSVKLGPVPGVAKNKHPEGMVITNKSDAYYSLMIVYDGDAAPNGSPTPTMIDRKALK